MSSRACHAALAAAWLAGTVALSDDPRATAEAPRWSAVAARDGLAYYGRSDGLVVLRAREEAGAPPEQVGRLRETGTIHALALDGNLAYLAAGTRGLLLADLADPARPRLVTRWDTPASVRDVLLARGAAFVADGRYGLRVLDVSHPEHPRQRASVPTRAELLALALDRERLATAEGSAGVRMFDVERPFHPDERHELDDSEGALDVAFVGDLLLVAAGPRGLLVYRDAQGSPEPVARLDVGRVGALEVRAAGPKVATVACGSDGLVVVALDDPAAPRAVSSTKLPRGVPAERHATDGPRTWIAGGRYGLGLLDLQDPERPVVLLPRERSMNVVFR